MWGKILFSTPVLRSDPSVRQAHKVTPVAPGQNASGAYQLTFTATNWNYIGTAGTQGSHLNAHLVSPYLSFDSVGTGAVLVYSSGGYAPAGGLMAWNFTRLPASV